MLVRHLFNLLAAAASIFVSSIGTTWLGLALGILLALSSVGVTAWRVFKTHGRDALLIHWRGNAKTALRASVLSAAVIYMPVLLWSVGWAVYEDHAGLVARSRSQRELISRNDDRLRDATAGLDGKLVECGNRESRLQGANGVLTVQNRDQQNTINSCQTQALKLMQPEPFQWHSVVLEPAEEVATSPNEMKARWLLMSNQALSPAQFSFSCTWPIIAAEIRVAGVAADARAMQLQGDRWGAIVSSPAWGPNSPVLITTTLRKAGDPSRIACNFALDSMAKSGGAAPQQNP